jgi:hypothetical protein
MSVYAIEPAQEQRAITIHSSLTREDALELLKIANQMHKTSPNYSDRPFDAQRIWTLFDTSVKHPSKVCVVYAKEGDEIIGGILGHMTPQYFSGDMVASDLGMFLKPEHRGGTAFVRLFKAFERWAVEHKATSIIVGHTTGNNTEKSKSMFTKLGYLFLGYIFQKEL